MTGCRCGHSEGWHDHIWTRRFPYGIVGLGIVVGLVILLIGTFGDGGPSARLCAVGAFVFGVSSGATCVAVWLGD